MTQRVGWLNSTALAIAISYAILATRYVEQIQLATPIIEAALVYVTSAGFYRLIIGVFFRVVEMSPFLMKLYWGQLYLEGLWSYTYTLENSDDATVYFGVWRIEQTVYETSVVGFGLTPEYQARSHVHSVSGLLKNGAVFEFVNIRSDSVDSSVEYYSRTTMFFEHCRGKVIRYPIRVRGKTIVYGGPLSGRICNNLFVRHENARTEQDVINELRANLENEGLVHPTSGDLTRAVS